MKFIAFFAIAAAFMTLAPTPSQAEDSSLKVRWTEKEKNGKRIVTIFIKNDGGTDLKKGEAEILIMGGNPNARQAVKLPIDAPKNREVSTQIELLSGSEVFSKDLRDENGKPLTTVNGKIISVTVSPIESKT